MGIFLLPSLPAIGIIILLFPFLFLSFKSNSYFKDYFNISFFLATIFIVFSCIINTFFTSEIYKGIYETNKIWVGIFNWLPYFWIFWIFQRFSYSQNLRKKIILIYLAGSIPVIISGLLQYFFKWHGPFIFFNGLVTWYSREIEPMDGMTGIFNNSNYLGIWLNIIWPFALVFFIDNLNYPKKRLISFIFLISIFLCTILTFSRNAWLGFTIASILILGIKSLKWIIPSLTLIVTPVLIGLGFLPNNFLTEIIRNVVPNIIFHQFNSSATDHIRMQIWESSMNYISQKPLIGWGASSFPELFKIKNGEVFFAHTHNLPLEIALSFGIPAAFIIITTMIYLLYFSRAKVFVPKQSQNKSLYDKAWWVSTLIFFFSHMFDVQYFDVRIGLTFWILLGGIRNIMKQDFKNLSIK